MIFHFGLFLPQLPRCPARQTPECFIMTASRQCWFGCRGWDRNNPSIWFENPLHSKSELGGSDKVQGCRVAESFHGFTSKNGLLRGAVALLKKIMYLTLRYPNSFSNINRSRCSTCFTVTQKNCFMHKENVSNSLKIGNWYANKRHLKGNSYIFYIRPHFQHF